MNIDSLRKKTAYVTLSVGDIIVDLMTKNIGLLLKRTRRIDMIKDDIYLWEILWTNNIIEPTRVPSSRYMEEDGLKLSIVAGMYDWYTAEDHIVYSD